jgi:hypothetical protein
MKVFFIFDSSEYQFKFPYPIHMKDKYLRSLSLLLLTFFTFNLHGQKINKTVLDSLDNLKIQGRATGKEHVVNPDSHKSFRYSDPANSVMKPLSACNPMIMDSTFSVVPFDGSGGSGGPGLPPFYRNDDWCSAAITLPFNFCFYGQQMNTVYTITGTLLSLLR